MDQRVKEAYQHCGRITRQAAKNFYYAIITLPKQKRWAIEAVYAFCRAADDIADGDAPLAEKKAGLAHLRKRLDAAARGEPEILADIALSDTIVRFGVDSHDLAEVIDGVEMDLSVTRYSTFDDLVLYCHRVASAVGLAVLPVLAANGRESISPPVREAGEALGLGMQLANIVRDVAEDLSRDRIYIPQEDLVRFEVSEDTLRREELNDQVRALLSFETGRAREYLRAGMGLLSHLPRRSRGFPFLLAAIYSRILKRIEEQGYDVFHGRASLPTHEKLALTLRAVGTAFLR